MQEGRCRLVCLIRRFLVTYFQQFHIILFVLNNQFLIPYLFYPYYYSYYHHKMIPLNSEHQQGWGVLPEQESDGVGSTRELVQAAGDALEAAGFSRLGGEPTSSSQYKIAANCWERLTNDLAVHQSGCDTSRACRSTLCYNPAVCLPS